MIYEIACRGIRFAQIFLENTYTYANDDKDVVIALTRMKCCGRTIDRTI